MHIAISRWTILSALGLCLTVGAASSGLLLYGLALIFGLTGETQLQAAGGALAAARPNQGAIFLALSLLIAGFAIRIGLLPIQWWVRGFENGITLRVLIFIESVG